MPIKHKRLANHWIAATLLTFVSWFFTDIPTASAALPMGGDTNLYYATQASATTPYKNYTVSNGSWSAAANLGTVTYATHFIRTINSPTKHERLTMLSNTNGGYEMYRWTGTAWNLDWTDTGGGGSASTYTPRFDIAYTSTGDAVAFYGTGSGTVNQQMKYRRYTSSTNTWGAATFMTVVATNSPGETRYLRVENRRGTDEFAISWADFQQNLSGNYYKFSTNAFSGEPSTFLQNNLSILTGAGTEIRTKVFDIAFEQNSGDLLICYGDDGSTDLMCNTRSAGTSGTWNTTRISYTAVNIETEEIDLAADPNPSADRIGMYAADSTLLDAEAAIWSGTAWGNRVSLDTSTNALGAGTTNGDIEWVRSGTASAAIVTYDDSAAAGFDWWVFDGTANTWTIQTDNTTAFSPVGTNDIYHEMERNPNNIAQLTLGIVDGNSDLAMKRVTYNGSTFTWSSGDNGSASHNANMHTSGGWSAAFAYPTFVIPYALTVDIVNASGSSVASPAYALTNIASANACNNTSTGYLGSSTQRIRVSNGTVTPGWSLGIAATGGATAKWTATTDTFDFNDPTNGSCGDGVDVDTDSGQLSFSASASGLVEPVASCTDTGVIPTSTTGFVEGTANSVTLYNGNSSATMGCYWDLTLISIYQRIPAYLMPGTYSLPLTMTITAA